MSVAFMRQLAARHSLDADDLIEMWCERAAMRQYLAGFSRSAAELWAIGDVEQLRQIGLHCSETVHLMLTGGRRTRPGTSAERGDDATMRRFPDHVASSPVRSST